MPRPSRKHPIVAQESEDGEEQSEEEPPQGTQRQRIQLPADDDSDEDSDTETGGGIAQEELETPGEENGKDQFVKKLVRYALACEYARLPIRREGIKEKVFGKHKVPFRQVFDDAQEQLRQKFGMEMIELPSKEKVTKKARIAAAKVTQPASTKTYILASTLPPQYRIPTILPPSIIPDVSTEAAYVGLYTMIISLISLFGQDGKLSDAKLINYLQRMNAEVNMPMDKTEAILQKMIRQGYLVKIKETNNGDEIIDWMVGPRGKVEVGNKGVAGLVEEVYGEDAPDDLAERIKSSLGLKRARGEREEEAAPAAAAVVENTQEASRRPRRSGRRANDEND